MPLFGVIMLSNWAPHHACKTPLQLAFVVFINFNKLLLGVFFFQIMCYQKFDKLIKCMVWCRQFESKLELHIV